MKRTLTLTLRADTIVVLNNHDHKQGRDVATFVCFKYTEASFEAAKEANGHQDGPIAIDLEDGNGIFCSANKYWMVDVRAPNRGNTLGGRDNVLIVEAELADADGQ